MEMEHQREGGDMLVMEMPSFRSISGGQEWPHFPFLGGLHQVDDAGLPIEGGDQDFEFASLFRDSLDVFEPVAADDIFSQGQIRAAYPLFGRPLDFHGDGQDRGRGGVDDVGGEEDDAAGEAEKPIDVSLSLSFRQFINGDGGPPSTSSSSASSASSCDELDAVPAESYCVWAPRSAPASPELRKKSHSAGGSSAASSTKWRLGDLVAGRSHSDGKEKFLFVASPGSSVAAEAKEKKEKTKGQQPPPAVAAEGKKKGTGTGTGRGGGKVVPEMDMAAAHRLYYTKGGAAAGERRRSFLPYRKDLLGFFASVGRSF